MRRRINYKFPKGSKPASVTTIPEFQLRNPSEIDPFSELSQANQRSKIDNKWGEDPF